MKEQPFEVNIIGKKNRCVCMQLTTDTEKGAPAPAAIHLLFTQFPYDG